MTYTEQLWQIARPVVKKFAKPMPKAEALKLCEKLNRIPAGKPYAGTYSIEPVKPSKDQPST